MESGTITNDNRCSTARSKASMAVVGRCEVPHQACIHHQHCKHVGWDTLKRWENPRRGSLHKWSRVKTDFQIGKRFPAASGFQEEPQQQFSRQKIGQRFPRDWKKDPGGAFLLPFQFLSPCMDSHLCESAQWEQVLVLGGPIA